jgi:hypothetical protein
VDRVHAKDGQTVKSEGYINYVAVRQGGERYIFIFDDAHVGDLVRTVIRFAEDPDLSFDDCSAAAVGESLHRMHWLERKKRGRP